MYFYLSFVLMDVYFCQHFRTDFMHVGLQYACNVYQRTAMHPAEKYAQNLCSVGTQPGLCIT